MLVVRRKGEVAPRFRVWLKVCDLSGAKIAVQFTAMTKWPGWESATSRAKIVVQFHLLAHHSLAPPKIVALLLSRKLCPGTLLI
jgi:hypothetical protein